MAKHTPGPWLQYAALSSDFHNIRYIMGGGGEHVASVASGFSNFRPNDFDQSTALANARLIAAAPDLLAELKSVSTIWANADPRDNSPFGETARRVNAAIAKAEGRNAGDDDDGAEVDALDLYEGEKEAR